MESMILSPSAIHYSQLYGDLMGAAHEASMARCACVACNSCTCACSCRVSEQLECECWLEE